MSSGWILHRGQGIEKQAPSASSDFTLFDQEPLIIDSTDNWLIDGKRGRRPCSHSSVNPVPRAYARGFGALPLKGVRNIHPRADARGFLWYGVNPRVGVPLQAYYFNPANFLYIFRVFGEV